MDTDEKQWHLIETRNGSKLNLYCIHAPTKELAIQILYRQSGIIFDSYVHRYDALYDYVEIVSIYQLNLDSFNGAIKKAETNVVRVSYWDNSNITVHVMSHGQKNKEVEYGANCCKCSELFPYAVKVENFKCWKCSHGY